MRKTIVAVEGRVDYASMLMARLFVERECFVVVDGSGRKGWGHSTGARLRES